MPNGPKKPKISASRKRSAIQAIRLNLSRRSNQNFPLGTAYLLTSFGIEQFYQRNELQNYFYLIVKDVATGNAVQQKDVQSFFRTGVNTGSDYLFTFVDIGSDDRLSKYLAPKPGGDALYKDIEAKAPVFLVSDRAIKNVDDVRTITVHPIKNYTRDVQLIYNQMGFESPTTRLTAIRFLKRVNKYLNLKPNMFGLGVNLNDMISDLLDRMESHSP